MKNTEMTFKIWFAQYKATFYCLDADINSTSDLEDNSWDIEAIKTDYYDKGLTPIQAYDYFYKIAQ